jgi:hypothetical protein
LHETLPGYERILVDGFGNLWAKPYLVDDPESCWHVFERRVARFAKACLPQDLVPLDIGQQALLGVVRDELDVEFVARYRLNK